MVKTAAASIAAVADHATDGTTLVLRRGRKFRKPLLSIFYQQSPKQIVSKDPTWREGVCIFG